MCVICDERGRAKSIRGMPEGVVGVVIEPEFRLWWIGSGYVIESQPLRRGSLAAGVRWDRGRCDR